MLPPTLSAYLATAKDFLAYLKDVSPKHSRLPVRCAKVALTELKKLHHDVNRLVTSHQQETKRRKFLKLIKKEHLAKCQALAKAKMPTLLGKYVICLPLALDFPLLCSDSSLFSLISDSVFR